MRTCQIYLRIERRLAWLAKGERGRVEVVRPKVRKRRSECVGLCRPCKACGFHAAIGAIVECGAEE